MLSDYFYCQLFSVYVIFQGPVSFSDQILPTIFLTHSFIQPSSSVQENFMSECSCHTEGAVSTLTGLTLVELNK